MNKEEMNKRQISFKGWDLYKHLPECNNVMTVVYASFNDIFIFNTDGLSETDKVDLVNVLISEMQSGTNITRQIIKQCDNTYFVY